MRPILFEILGFGVPSYSVFMGLGYVAALWVLMRLATVGKIWGADDTPSDGTSPHRGQVWDLFIVMVVSSIIGSKLGHTLFEAPGHLDDDGNKIESLGELLAADPLHWARLGEAGYVWYGGMITCLAVAAFYFWRRPKLDPWDYSDLFAPAIMAGAFVGRLGCFMAGCCYGQPTDLPWGVTFPTSSSHVHPTQLYDCTVALVLGFILFRRYPVRKFRGECIALLLICYPVLRSLTEAFRGDADRGSFGALSTSQWLSIPLLLIGVAMYVHRSRTASRGTDVTPTGVAG